MTRNWKIAMVCWIIVFTVTTAFGIHKVASVASDGVDSRNAICALVNDYKHRIQDSLTFLVTHPKGLPGLITRSEILNSVKNEKLTARILDREVHCGPN